MVIGTSVDRQQQQDEFLKLLWRRRHKWWVKISTEIGPLKFFQLTICQFVRSYRYCVNGNFKVFLAHSIPIKFNWFVIRWIPNNFPLVVEEDITRGRLLKPSGFGQMCAKQGVNRGGGGARNSFDDISVFWYLSMITYSKLSLIFEYNIIQVIHIRHNT